MWRELLLLTGGREPLDSLTRTMLFEQWQRSAPTFKTILLLGIVDFTWKLKTDFWKIEPKIFLLFCPILAWNLFYTVQNMQWDGPLILQLSQRANGKVICSKRYQRRPKLSLKYHPFQRWVINPASVQIRVWFAKRGDSAKVKITAKVISPNEPKMQRQIDSLYLTSFFA